MVEQALTLLRLFRQAKADLHLAVGQREAAQQGQPAARPQPHLAEHGARMFHEVAPDLIEAIANAMRLAVARGEEQPGVLEPPAGEHNGARTHHEAPPAQRRYAERLDPVAGLVEVHVREIRVDENARAGRPLQRLPIRRAEAHRRRRPQRNRRRQAIVFEQAVFVIAHAFLVGADREPLPAWQAQHLGGSRIVTRQLRMADRPAAVRHPRTWRDVEFREQHAAARPEVTRAAEIARPRHVIRAGRIADARQVME